MHRLLILALTALTASAWADVFNIGDSERGSVCTIDATFCPGGNFGAGAGKDYLAGVLSPSSNTDVTKFRNWFEFAIPSLSGGSLVSATFSLDDFGRDGGALTFAIYGLTAQPLALTDVTTGNPFGSVGTSNASNGTTITIQLNSAALAAIAAAQGANLFIGGIDSGETVTDPHTVSPISNLVGDFEASLNGYPDPSSTYNTVLHFTTAPAAVPEPASILLLATMLGTFGIRRARAQRRTGSRTRSLDPR